MLTKLKWGASIDETKAAAPDLFDKPRPNDKPGDVHTRLAPDPELIDVDYSVDFDRDTKKLSGMKLEVPTAAKAMLATAWGPGKDGKDTIGRPRTFWFDPAGGWRAYSEQGFDDQHFYVVLVPYLPVAKLLGDAPDQIGFAPQGILGATLDDLRKRFPGAIVETDQAKADKDRKELNNMMGSNLDKQLGSAKPDVKLQLKPTEFAEFWTIVNLSWSDDGHVQEASFQLAYEATPSAKADLRALIDKKWPNGKPGKWIVDQATISQVNDHYYVAVLDDTISKAWEVRVTSTPQFLKSD